MTFNNKNNNIFLWGFMGSGKTQVGRALANSMDLSFVDLDSFIAVQEGQSISTLFLRLGEDQFRKLESQYLQHLSQEHSIVISTGGGTPILASNQLIMLNSGTSIFLDVPYEILWKRIAESVTIRPLISRGKTELEELFHKRKPYYLDADLLIDANLQIDQVVDQISEKLSGPRIPQMTPLIH